MNCGTLPAAPQNGQRSVSGTTLGSTVTYSCNLGYKLQGSNIRMCMAMADTQWSGSTSECIRKLCKDESNIMATHATTTQLITLSHNSEVNRHAQHVMAT